MLNLYVTNSIQNLINEAKDFCKYFDFIGSEINEEFNSYLQAINKGVQPCTLLFSISAFNSNNLRMVYEMNCNKKTQGLVLSNVHLRMSTK